MLDWREDPVFEQQLFGFKLFTWNEVKLPRETKQVGNVLLTPGKFEANPIVQFKLLKGLTAVDRGIAISND